MEKYYKYSKYYEDVVYKVTEQIDDTHAKGMHVSRGWDGVFKGRIISGYVICAHPFDLPEHKVFDATKEEFDKMLNEALLFITDEKEYDKKFDRRDYSEIL